MKKYEKSIKKSIGLIKPYTPGKPIEELFRELKLDKIIKLASNENPLGASPKAIEAIKENLYKINRYPESSSYSLKNSLSEFISVKPENIIIGNGSSEIIYLVLQCFISSNYDSVIYPFPSFLIYEILTYTVGGKSIKVNLDEKFYYNIDKILKSITSKTKVIILCNPNNPTGTIIYKDQINYFLRKIPDSIIIISDEAYCEYAENKDYGSMLPYINKKNIIIARTFSKLFGLAGLRIGYGIAKKEIIEILERIRPPFNTTLISQEAANAALKDTDFIEKTKKINNEGKQFLYSKLKNLGINYTETEANFILVKFGKKTEEICNKLLHKGIIIRKMTSFGLTDYARITIGTKQENRFFIDKLKEVI
jgi:histidinol-phosphate aminotransferase